MTDNDEQRPHIFGIPLPAELAESMERAHSLHTMETTQLNHAMFEFINGLDKDQIQLLDIILLRVAHDPHWGHMLSGYIDGISLGKFERCPACGEPVASHDPSVLLPPEDDGGSEMPDDRVPVYSLQEKIDMRIGSDMREMMDLYGLDDVWDIEKEEFLYYQCTATEGSPHTGCGMHYVSIEDRMLRQPGLDGCSGCQMKSAHG